MAEAETGASDPEKPVVVKKAIKRRKPQQSSQQNGEQSNKRKTVSAYHMFLRERIPQLKKDSPSLNPKEYLSTVCAVWRTLTEEDRNVYSERASEENKRKQATMELVEGKNGQKERHIPIFTQAFIQHNKEREKEFRRLQKEASEVQQQSALLSAHSDSLRTAIARLESEVGSQRARSSTMATKLEKARSAVMEALIDISSNVTESGVESVDVFKSFSTAELISNLRTTITTCIDDLTEEQRDYVKTTLLSILDHLSDE